MKKILIAYTTNSGSTEDIARIVGEELGKDDNQVDIRRLEEVSQIEGYDAVVVGAPMILGWHREAVKFVKKHQHALGKIPVAYFFTAMSLTQTGEDAIGTVPVYLDPGLAKPPKRTNRLSLRERYSTPSNYLTPVLKAAPLVKPVSVGFFGGKLELFRLKVLQMLFVMLIIQAQPGDLRNRAFIRQWAGDYRSRL
jgi:menaquinone-dependent protoporphyrinogen IX oxidase